MVLNLFQGKNLLAGLGETLGDLVNGVSGAVGGILSPTGSSSDHSAGLTNGGLLGNGGLLSGIIGDDGLLGDQGLLGGLLSNGGLLGDLLDVVLGPDGLLASLVGQNDVIEELLTVIISIVSDFEGPVDPFDFDVVLLGTPGKDNFLIGNQNTYADGYANIDTATYAASAVGYDYAKTANGVFFSDGVTLDYFQNVERVAFTDATLVLDTGVHENGGMAYRIYQAAFDRAPDVAGLKFWLNQLDNGVDLVTISEGFLWSNEFRQTYGTDLTDKQFITQLYENILQRAGETAGINYWQSELSTGATTRAHMLASFSESVENVELVGSSISDGYVLA